MWYMLLIPALSKQRQVELYEFEANLVYIVPSQLGLQNKKVDIGKEEGVRKAW